MTDVKRIWEKTQGHCHFCGDPVELEKRGWRDGDLAGYWEIDHVIQRQKGGESSLGNYLPACTRCNRLRWHRTGDAVRELLILGLIARDAIRKGGIVGKRLQALRQDREAKNIDRRAARRNRGRPIEELTDSAPQTAAPVKSTGARAGDVLVGIRSYNLAMRLKISVDQRPTYGGRIKGPFCLLDAGSGTYSGSLEKFVGREFSGARDLVQLVQRDEPKGFNFLNANSLSVYLRI